MPVKLGDIPSVIINKKEFGMFDTHYHVTPGDTREKEGFNKALSLQSEVCIGLNREKLAMVLQENQTLTGIAWSKLTQAARDLWLRDADSIISAESTLIESKGRNGEK